MPRIIELTWTCGQCGRQIKGRYKTCPHGCGSSREKSEMNMDGLHTDRDGDGFNDAASVTDPELLKLANAGADWFCQHCESGNRGDTDTCSVCSAPRYGEKEENHPAPQFSRDHEGKKKPEEWEVAEANYAREEAEREARIAQEERDREDDEDRRIRMDREQAERKRHEAEYARKREEHRAAAEKKRLEEAEWEAEQEARRLKKAREAAIARALMIAAAILAVIGVTSFFVWGMQTHPVQGTVTEMSWVHNTHKWTWTQVTKEDWKADIHERSEIQPVNGSGERAGVDIISCRQKHHHYEQYQCGTQEESYDCSTTHTESYQDTCYDTESYVCGETCTDNGNGFATCYDKTCTRSVSYSCTKTRTVTDPKTCYRTVPKYCDRSIEKPWCSYQTQTWASAGTVTASGTGEEGLYWKEVELGLLDKATRTHKYMVTVDYRDKDRIFHYEQKCDSLADYNSWDEGESVTLHKRNFGWIASMEHGGRVFDVGGDD